MRGIMDYYILVIMAAILIVGFCISEIFRIISYISKDKNNENNRRG